MKDALVSKTPGEKKRLFSIVCKGKDLSEKVREMTDMIMKSQNDYSF